MPRGNAAREKIVGNDWRLDSPHFWGFAATMMVKLGVSGEQVWNGGEDRLKDGQIVIDIMERRIAPAGRTATANDTNP